MKVADALAEARRRGVERLDAQLLLAHRLQCPRTWLLAHDEEIVAEPQARAYLADLCARASGVPLAYLVGEREFHGLLLHIDRGVLVPRPETELLVDWALERIDALAPAPRPRVVDLGTGSGAVALAIKHRRPQAEVTATDIDPLALSSATANARRLGLTTDFVAGDWWQPLQRKRFHVVVSNPPYVAPDDPHLHALAAEPRRALTDGGDGLRALQAIADGAPGHLEAGGWLLLEHGYDQAAAVRQMLLTRGFTDVSTRQDLAHRDRCSAGHWRPPNPRR